MKKFWAFLTSRFFWINILFAAVAFFFVIKIALYFTNIYSHHGEKIKVPDLIGLQISEAKKRLKKVKLKLVVVDSIYKWDVQPGSIVKYFPEKNSFVKRKRKIKLAIAACNPEKVVLQKSNDLSLRQAIQMLHSKGLEVGKIHFKPSMFSNLVLGFEQNKRSIDENSVLEKGTVIDIIVGRASDYYVSSPRLKNKTIDDAIIQLLMSGLNVGKIFFSDDVHTLEDSLRAVVYKQSRYSNKKIIPGTAIDIYLKMNPD